MDRNTGLRRTSAITAGLAIVSAAGILAAGAAAHAESTSTTTTTSTTTSTDSSSSSSADSPSLSTGSDDSGQATSGGS
jgi:hypothetical protein